jgi:hypothetical protein
MRCQGKPWRFVIIRLSVAISIGAATTYGIAWLSVLFADPYSSLAGAVWTDGTYFWGVSRGDAIGATAITTWRARIPGPSSSSHVGEIRPLDLLPSWHILNRRFPDDEEGLDIQGKKRWIDARGWPWRALWCEYDYVGGPAVRGGMPLFDMPPWDFYGFLAPRALPWRPIWPGFAADVGTFAGAAAGLLLLPRALIRARRRRRGHCVDCAYPLLNAVVCPECGRGPGQ